MRLPAEWEPHARTLMGWPCRLELWGETIDRARDEYATVANAIAEFEPVTMIANPGADSVRARAACSAAVEILELPLDDSWLRDSGPIYVLRDAGGRVAVHFGFNAWGEKFPPWDHDAEVGRLAAEALGDAVVRAPIVLEGGSILSDGAGVLLTTEECLLNPNRNPEPRPRSDRVGPVEVSRRRADRVARHGAGRGPGHRWPRRPDRDHSSDRAGHCC